MKVWQENQIQALITNQSDHQLFQAICVLGNELGFDYCAYGLRMPLPLMEPKVFMLNNYPEDWQRQYQANNYLAIDPTVKHATNSLLPLIWTDDLFVQTRDLWEEAHSFGVRFGWAQSIRDFNGVVSMLTLARSNESISETELNAKRIEVAWLTQMAHEGMSKCLNISRIIPEASARLSKREIEVLQWTAVGKTSGEISSILNIAERTVNYHINHTIAKLNVVNKTAAAIKAATLGLL
jgi:LuxR family quorum-sensing system transcriptional regulator SolR